jgi:hypothetical protein
MLNIHRYVPAIAFAGVLALGAPACAAQTYGYGYPRGGYGRDTDRRAYDRGYREGLDQGRDDARHDRRYSLDRHGEYRDADDGYRRGDGDREYYRRSYRAGFQAGYNEAYNRNSRYGGAVYPANPSYPSYPSDRGYGTLARDNGYREGVEAGRRDARDRERYDPVRAMKRYYRDDSGYDRRYGSRDDYKRDYLAAFEAGYREGYGRR